MTLIQAAEIVRRLAQGLPLALIDLRSELEFAQGALPISVNMPIMMQKERHEVGICYKEQGVAAAIALGHRLVNPFREERIEAWRAFLAKVPVDAQVIFCWRGGMRSDIAQKWLAEKGLAVPRIDGGYKAVRQILRAEIERDRPLMVLGGLTGSGKTALLHSLPWASVDLEGAAQHRGSAFGAVLDRQPIAQASFENLVGLQLVRTPKLALVEDESRQLGQLTIPEIFYQRMQKAPMIWVEDPFSQRVERIYLEYIAQPLLRGFDHAVLSCIFQKGLLSLKRRLDRDYSRLHKALEAAFQQPEEAELHKIWIADLLKTYYDPRYLFAIEKYPRQIAFRGATEECRAFCLNLDQGRS